VSASLDIPWRLRLWYSRVWQTHASPSGARRRTRPPPSSRARASSSSSNVRFPLGELDLVCRDGGAWVFVEVKCRQARWGDAPAAAVEWRKRRRLVRLAQHYLKWRRLGEVSCRFDVIAVTVRDDGTTDVRHLPAAFDATGAV